MTTIKINEQIAFLRKQKGLTQEELANALGVANQAVSKWESAQCCPDIQLLPDVAKIFDVSIDELVGYKSTEGLGDICLEIKEHYIPIKTHSLSTFRLTSKVRCLTSLLTSSVTSLCTLLDKYPTISSLLISFPSSVISMVVPSFNRMEI